MEDVKFPDGRDDTVKLVASDLDDVTERLCVNCGGTPRHMSANAKTYTVVRCPECDLLHPGEPIQ